MELYKSCSGNWDALIGLGIGRNDIRQFLTYAATFLSNVGNYYGSGDQKFTTGVADTVLQRLAARSPGLEKLYASIAKSINSTSPSLLGFPSANSQSSYYPMSDIQESDAAKVSKVLEQARIFPENTRLQRTEDGEGYNVLIASIGDGSMNSVQLDADEIHVVLTKGDHSGDLEKVCTELTKASQYSANERQKSFLQGYNESFRTGSLDAYRQSLRTWVKDKAPRVENIFGFVEPYRDPHGIRAEFEGLVAIADDEETKLLTKLVENSSTFIRRLPWASAENDGKGLFEKSLFEPPDFSSIHSLAYCSSIIFPGINVPNYNDIREEDGFKNVIISNRMMAESEAEPYPFIDDSEFETFKKHKFAAYYWWVVLHELLGHGTGKMMVETKDGRFNFDVNSPPVSPLTNQPITSWYKPGQTWTGQFGDLATTVDECRAELVGAYLMDDPELLALLGFTDSSDICPDDLAYNLYQQLGVDGLRGLANFDIVNRKWGQAHSRAHFAMLRCLLRDGQGVVEILHDSQDNKLTVRVDRAKIRTHGKRALGDMLLHLHMFRCTADAQGCREYYEELSRVDGEFLAWRDVVLKRKPPPLVFVHANTFLKDGHIELKEYEPTVEGVIQSWAERAV
jgi:dipeptidyl-peptidase-3